jgi:hypothetical protein
VSSNTILPEVHGPIDGDRVTFLGGTPPGGLDQGQLYHVVSASTDWFQVSASSGGAAIELTSAGDARVIASKFVPEAFREAGKYRLVTWTRNLPCPTMSLEGPLPRA